MAFIYKIVAAPIWHDAVARDLHERVFAWMTLGDERNLAATWVAGRELYRRGLLRRHRARRGPAGAPARGRHQRVRDPVRAGIRQSVHEVLPGRRLRDDRLRR